MQKMNKVLSGQQYIANFLDQPFRIGSIFRMDDNQSILALHFNDRFPAIDLAPLTDSGSKGSLRFSEQESVDITFGGSATNGIGKSEVQLKFKKADASVGVFDQVAVEALRYETVLANLQELWKERGYTSFLREYFMVFEIVTAASGTLVYSEERNNDVVLSHELGEPVKKLSDLGSGQFEYVRNTKRTLEIIRKEAHRPLFKAFRFKKNWEPEVLG